MGTKVKELDNSHDGDRGSCPICNPRRGISMDRVWAWSQAHPGENPFRT